MDATRFDSLLRSLSLAPSRRRTLRLLAGLLLGGPLAFSVGALDAHDALKKCKKLKDKARRKKCVKKAKKHNAQHAAPLVQVFETHGTFLFTVPVAGTLRIDAFGAGGASGGPGGDGVESGILRPGGAGGDPGAGGQVTASVAVAAGEALQITVGGAAGAGARGGDGEGGFAGAGGGGGGGGVPGGVSGSIGEHGGANSGGGGGGAGGGGFSEVRRSPFAVGNRLLLANGGSGGGGGGGGSSGTVAGGGGGGGAGGSAGMTGTLNGGAGGFGDEGFGGRDGGSGGPATAAFGPPGAVFVPDQQTGTGKVILTLTPA